MFLRLLGQSIRRRISRKLLAVLTVWIGVSLIVSLMGLNIDVRDKMNRELQSFGSNIRLEPIDATIPIRFGGREIETSTAPKYLREADLARLKEIFWRNNIAAFSPRLEVRARVRDDDVPLIGVWIDRPVPQEGSEPFVTGARQTYSHWQIEGTWPEPRRDTAQVLVGRNVATRLGIGPGDRIVLETPDAKSAEVSVVGVLRAGEREDEAIVAPMELVQRLTGLTDRVSYVDINALTTPENELALKYREDPNSLTPEEYEQWVCTPYPESVAADIQDGIPGSVARIVRRVTDTQGAILTRIGTLMFLLGVVTFIATIFGVSGVLTSSVLERRSEVALMQAIGAHRRSVLGLFLAEASAIGLSGGLAAGLTGALLAQWLVQSVFGVEASLHPVLLLLSPLIGLLVGWMGNAWPVWHTLKQDTARVLQEG